MVSFNKLMVIFLSKLTHTFSTSVVEMKVAFMTNKLSYAVDGQYIYQTCMSANYIYHKMHTFLFILTCHHEVQPLVCHLGCESLQLLFCLQGCDNCPCLVYLLDCCSSHENYLHPHTSRWTARSPDLGSCTRLLHEIGLYLWEINVSDVQVWIIEQ